MNEDRVKLHFNGWSPKYDTWMDMDELIKLNDMNLSLMKLDKEEHKASSSKNYTQCDLINEIVYSLRWFDCRMLVLSRQTP